MECNKNGRKRTSPAAAGGRGFKRKCRARGESVVRLALAAAVPCTSSERSMRINLVPPSPPDLPISTPNIKPTEYPFMNNMDEISYWIYTKRAPCLFNYDNTVKRQVEEAHCSNKKPASVKSKNEEQQPSPKKKRKLKLLDEDSVSTEKQQNIYFKPSQNQKTAPSSCKSDALGSKVNFNIKNSTVQQKSKKLKLQRNCQSTPHKINKIATSTPKGVNLRRSLRKAQQNNNNTHLNSSFEIFNTGIINGNADIIQAVDTKHHVKDDINDQTRSKVILSEKTKNQVVPNGQFEDLSDVSGFTANYIRSTKMHSSKTPRKLRNRNNRTLIKEAKQNEQSDEIIICVNKAVNTDLPDTRALNCSTDSSQNVLNLVTLKNNERSSKINKSTSVLKFMDSKLENNTSNDKTDKMENKNNINISFQSRSSGTSRYPKRHKNNTTISPEQNCSNINNPKANTSKRKNNIRKNNHNLNLNENLEEKIVSRTRSGRRIGIKLHLEESGCSMQQLNDSMEQVSSSAALNVACPNEKISKKNNSTSRCLRSRTCRYRGGQICEESVSDKSNKKLSDEGRCALVQSTPKCNRPVKKSMAKVGHSLSRDSLRNKSGFAACFSESDSDSEPLRQRKFFC